MNPPQEYIELQALLDAAALALAVDEPLLVRRDRDDDEPTFAVDPYAAHAVLDEIAYIIGVPDIEAREERVLREAGRKRR